MNSMLVSFCPDFYISCLYAAFFISLLPVSLNQQKGAGNLLRMKGAVRYENQDEAGYRGIPDRC